MALDLVKRGKRVVRLVPGDPRACPSARGEIANYRREAVSVDVVRGVSAREGLEVPAAPWGLAASVHLFAGRYRSAPPVPSALA